MPKYKISDEGLLSDQLKMIYLEERDRIHLAALKAAQKAAVVAGFDTRAAKRIFASINSPIFGTTGQNMTSARFDERVPKTRMLDDRLRTLNQIYNNGKSPQWVFELFCTIIEFEWIYNTFLYI